MLQVASSSCQFEASANNNNNEDVEVKPVLPKKDFRFKVIEVQNGPKWFVWPKRNRSSSEDVDENHNKIPAAQDGIPNLSASEPALNQEPTNEVSSMFKILSIEKNWESATDSEDDEVECAERRRTKSI